MAKRTAIIITNPMIAANESAKVTLSKFLRVISPFYGKLQVIGGNLHIESDLENVELISSPIRRAPNKVKRIIEVLVLQIKMSVQVAKNVKKKQTVFFWIGDKMFLPFLTAKVKMAEINYFIYGNPEKEGEPGIFAKLSTKLIRLMAQNSDYVCMESPSVKNEWEGLKIKKEKIIHLYTKVLTMNSLDQRKNIVGMVCRLTAGKHVLESIQAFSEFHKLNKDWQLEIIGSGVQVEECKKIIQDLGIESAVLMYGWIEHDKISEITKRWKYLLFPSDTEGMPNSVIEMMIQGIPVIASPVGGICDIVVENVTGWLIPSCSAQQIRNALENAVEADHYNEMAKNAREVILDKFVLKAAQKQVEEQSSH